jgi:hypothetical protein
LGAYILRRLLLVIPTLFGVMVINFALTQFVPGGPIDQIKARFEGEGDSIQNLSGTEGAGVQEQDSAMSAPAACHPSSWPSLRCSSAFRASSAMRLCRRAFAEGPGMPERSDPGCRTLPDHDGQIPDLRLRRELFPLDLGGRAGGREDAGLDHAWPLVNADRLSHLDSPGHPQGGARRVAFRHLDKRNHHRGLCDPRLPVRDHADGGLCRRLLLPVVPAARPDQRQLGQPERLGQDHRLSLAHHPAGDGAADFLLCRR